MMGLVDVRDCAEAHFKALTVPEAANKRFVVVERACWFQDFGEILHKHYGDRYNVAHKPMSKCLAWFIGLFDTQVHLMHSYWGMEQSYGT